MRFLAVNAQGTAVIRTVGASTFCRTGSSISANIKVDITGGTGIYTVIYRAVTGTNTPVNSTITNYASGTSIPVSQSASTTYTLVSATENNTGLNAGISGSAVVTIFEPFLGTITHATCQNAAGSVVISALPLTPWTIKSSTNQILANRVGVVTYTLPLPVGTNNFTITNSSGCVVPYSVTINPPPAAPNTPVPNTIQLTCSQTSFDQSWTAVENAAGYEMDVSPNADFSTFLPGYESKSLGNITYEKISGINPATVYYVRLRAKGECAVSANSATSEVSPILTTTYDNGTWSNGLPDTNKHIVFNSTYTVNANMNGCSCQVNTGVAVTVNSGNTLKLENGLNVQGSLTFEDDASLIQVNEAVNTGNIVYKRKTTVRRYDFTYWSSPITKAEGFTLYDLSPYTLADKYTSYNPNASWVISYNGVLPMNAGEGYSVRGPQYFDITIAADFTANFTGVPNNGNISVTTVPSKWNLLGNPYPSAIDITDVYEANPTLGSLFFWKPTTPPAHDPTDNKYKYSSNDYAAINKTGGVKTNSAGMIPSGFIAAAQGFFTKPEVSTVNFTNTMRVEGQNSHFFKQNSATGKNRVWLNFTNSEGAFKQLLIGYMEGAINGYDANYDATTMSGNSFVDFYSINETNKLAIQGRALPFEENDVIPLGYKSTIAGTFTIAIDTAEGIFEHLSVYVEDKVTNTFYDLTCGDYNFDTAAGTFTDRFVLHYNNIEGKTALITPVISNAVLSCNQTSYTQQWTAVKNAKGYKIEVALDAGFTSFLAGYENKELGNVTTETVTGLTPGAAYFVRIRAFNDCGSSLNSNVITPEIVSTVYENGAWSNGFPDSSKKIIFNSDYTINTNMNACSCQVNLGAAVMVNSGVTLQLENVLNVQGSLTFENNASLVQINEAVNTGQIVYKRYSAPMQNFDWTFWSSPVLDYTLFEVSPNTILDKYQYYDPTSGWQTSLYGAAIMQPGVGYQVRTPKDGVWPNGEVVAFPYSQLVNFTGVPNNGTILGANFTTGQWHLTGNPYPSALDVEVFLVQNPKLYGTIQIWNHNTPITNLKYSSDDYSYYNFLGGIAGAEPGQGVTSSKPTGKIAAGQAFFVRTWDTGTITFNNSMRVMGQNTQFFKSVKTSNNSSVEKHRLWLNLTNASNGFRQILIGYALEATNNYDSYYDSTTSSSATNLRFYSINQYLYNIQGYALPFNDTSTVPLGYSAILNTPHTISIDEVDGLFVDQDIYLEDKTTNNYHDLKAGSYTFTTAAGTFNDRFVIHYVNNSSSATGKKTNADFSKIDNSEIVVFVKNGYIGVNASEEQIDKIIIYDVNGRILFEKNNVNNTSYLTHKVNAVKQLLIVKTILKNGKISKDKVVL